jgi:hypothetical protein
LRKYINLSPSTTKHRRKEDTELESDQLSEQLFDAFINGLQMLKTATLEAIVKYPIPFITIGIIGITYIITIKIKEKK